MQFASHQTLNLKAIWSKQQVGDFKQLHVEQDEQHSKERKARMPADKVSDNQPLCKGF